MLAKHYKPKWTIWRHKTVRQLATAHKRRVRRASKQYLRSGDIRIGNRAARMLTNRDFD